MGAASDPYSALVAQTLELWGIDPGVTVTFVKHRENLVLRADPPGSPSLALRFHRPDYRADAELSSELDWLAVLGRHGIEVPQVMPALSGALWAIVGEGDTEHRVSVQRWIDAATPLGDVGDLFGGTPLHPLLDFGRLGDLAGRLHQVASSAELPEGFVRGAWDAEGLAGQTPLWGDPAALPTLLPEERVLLRQAQQRILEVLTALPRDRGSYGVVHADMTPENVLIDTDGRLTLIDFDDFGESWYLFDLATILFFATPRPDYPALRDALLHGYRVHRQLSAAEIAAFDAMLLARGLSYLGWSAARPGNEASTFIEQQVAPWVLRAAAALLGVAPSPWERLPASAETDKD